MPTRSYDRYEEGDVLSAARLRDEFGEVTWLAGLEATPPLYLEKAAGNPCLWIDLPDASVPYANVGGSTIPANGLVELTAWHEDSRSWDGQLPANSGLVRFGVNGVYDVPAGKGGRAWVVGDVVVLGDTDVATADISGQWLTTRAGFATALSVHMRTGLKVLASQSGVLWHARFSGSLG